MRTLSPIVKFNFRSSCLCHCHCHCPMSMSNLSTSLSPLNQFCFLCHRSMSRQFRKHPSRGSPPVFQASLHRERLNIVGLLPEHECFWLCYKDRCSEAIHQVAINCLDTAIAGSIMPFERCSIGGYIEVSLGPPKKSIKKINQPLLATFCLVKCMELQCYVRVGLSR